MAFPGSFGWLMVDQPSPYHRANPVVTEFVGSRANPNLALQSFSANRVGHWTPGTSPARHPGLYSAVSKTVGFGRSQEAVQTQDNQSYQETSDVAHHFNEQRCFSPRSRHLQTELLLWIVIEANRSTVLLPSWISSRQRQLNSRVHARSLLW